MPLLFLGSGLTLLTFLLVVDHAVDQSGDVMLLFAGAVFTVLGALILARTDGNRVGWVVSVTGLALLASGVAGYFADEGNLIAESLSGALWLSWFFLVGLLVFWFPTGRPLSPRWRWIGWIGFLGEGLSLTYIVSDQICLETSDGGICQVWVDNPIGIPGVPNPEFGELSGLTLALGSGFVLLAAVSLVVRYVRARGVERLQVKWFAFAVVFVIALLVAQETIGNAVGIPEAVGSYVFGLAVLTMPVAVSVSVLRYRLYEIDRIVSRTVSYTVVVVLLVAVYVGGVTWLSSLLPDQSRLVVAATTLAVAALFNPVRRRVQGWVDRRFNRSRYDAQRVMDRFAGSLRDQVDSDEVVGGWVDVVSETMQPAAVGVWLRGKTAS
ncbi:MAG: hypothetical protein WED83_00215 [Acidimicrobiia bacterium]